MIATIKTLAPAGPSIHEALHKAVLHGFVWSDVMPFDLEILLPLQDRIAGQFRPVFADHHTEVAQRLGDPVQFVANPDA